MQDAVRAGIVTFKFTQSDADYHAVQGIRLKPGHTLDEALQGFDDALSGDHALAVQGVAEIYASSVLIGGALTYATAPISMTISLPVGTYYFFDYADVGVIQVRVHTLRAVGPYTLAPLPHFTDVVIAEMPGDMPRFQTPTSLAANGNFFFYNASDEAHEVMFRPTTPGVTDDYITQFYDAVLSGGTRPPSPWTGTQHGLQPMSPGQWAVVHIDLPAGSWAEICYVPDDQSGIPHAYEGMHQMVTLS